MNQQPSQPRARESTHFPRRLRQLPGLRTNPGGVLAVLFLSLWALGNWLLSLRSVMRDYNPLPVWDYWRVANFLDRYKAFDFSVLWLQHNDHRIVFPELIFAADMLLFHGHQVLPLIVSVLCYAGVWGTLAWAFHSDQHLPWNIRKTGMLLAGIVIGWQGSSVVLGNTFLLQWTMLQFAVVAALALLMQSARRAHSGYLLGALFAGVVATYSSANGMLIWPLLLAAGFLIRLTRTKQLVIAITGVVAIGIYFIGYHSAEFSFLSIFEHPVYAAGFVLSYLSMPMGALGQPVAALGFGAFNFFGLSLLLIVAARRKLLATAPGVVLFGNFLFTLGTAMITAAARMNPSDPKFLASLAARYITLPLVNWAVLLLAALWLAGRRKWELASAGNIGVLACLCLLGATSSLRPWIRGNGSFIADEQVAAVSMESGLSDPALEGKLYPDPGLIERALPALKKNGETIYASYKPATWMGRPARLLFQDCGEGREGVPVASVYPVLGGFEVTGVSPRRIFSAPQFIFVDGRGLIVGFGEEITAGVPAVDAELGLKAKRYWVGFINGQYGSSAFSTYQVGQEGSCMHQVTAVRPLGGTRQVQATASGKAIAGVDFAGQGWKENALPPLVTAENGPGGGFWSSWAGADQSTGQLTSSAIETGPNHCLILSTLHGPSIQGLALRVEDAASSRVLETVPLRGGETRWKFWRVPIEPSVARVKIVGEDKGTGWGQWLAFGLPARCR